MTPAEAAIDALAAYRITRLITTDTITRPLRARVIRFAYYGEPGPVPQMPSAGGPWTSPASPRARRIDWSEWEEHAITDEDAPPLAEWVTCRWCAGVWAAAGVTIARRVAPRLWSPVAVVLATSAAATLVAGLEND